MNAPTRTGEWEFKGVFTMNTPSVEMCYAFPKWTRCVVKSYHDGLRASINHRSGSFVALTTVMHGEWREPMEKQTTMESDGFMFKERRFTAEPVATGIEAEVCQSIAERQKEGIAKYGTSLADADLTPAQTLRHAREEAQDLACYLMRAEKEAEALRVVTQEMLAVCLRISAFLETDVEMDNATHGALNVAINHAQKV